MNKQAKVHYDRMALNLLQSIKIKCKECQGIMIRVHDLHDDTVVGYSCEDCTHYYLFDNNPI